MWSFWKNNGVYTTDLLLTVTRQARECSGIDSKHAPLLHGAQPFNEAGSQEEEILYEDQLSSRSCRNAFDNDAEQGNRVADHGLRRPVRQGVKEHAQEASKKRHATIDAENMPAQCHPRMSEDGHLQTTRQPLRARGSPLTVVSPGGDESDDLYGTSVPLDGRGRRSYPRRMSNLPSSVPSEALSPTDALQRGQGGCRAKDL